MNNQLIRNIQVDLILGNTNPIIDWFNGIWNDLSVIEESVYHNRGKEFIYFNNKKEWIFFRDDKSDIFWCHYERYWAVFRNEFSLDYTSIQELTKFLVEDALCNNIVITDIDFLTSSNRIENALTDSNTDSNTDSVATPYQGLKFIYKNIEDALNNSASETATISNPARTNEYFEKVVDESLYNSSTDSIATPKLATPTMDSPEVEDALNNSVTVNETISIPLYPIGYETLPIDKVLNDKNDKDI